MTIWYAAMVSPRSTTLVRIRLSTTGEYNSWFVWFSVVAATVLNEIRWPAAGTSAATSPYGPINETRAENALGTALRVLGVSLASSGGAIVHLDNLRPEKLEYQAEQTQYEKQLPFTRSEPYPHLLARSFDALEQVMREQLSAICSLR